MLKGLCPSCGSRPSWHVLNLAQVDRWLRNLAESPVMSDVLGEARDLQINAVVKGSS